MQTFQGKIPYLLLLFSVAACVARPQPVWVNAYPDKHDFTQDRYACKLTSAQATPPSAATGSDVFGHTYSYDVNQNTRDDLFVACMNSKDWNFIQPTTTAPSPSN